jgi:hypothetical protein
MLELRASPTEPVLRLTWDQFEHMVRRGQVAPTDLVRANVITGDHWWTADNLVVFHGNSTVQHPYGEHLAPEVEAKNRRLATERQEKRAVFDYEWVRNVLDAHRVPPLSMIVEEPGVVTASRLVTMPDNMFHCVVTCVYTNSQLRVELAGPPRWEWVPHLTCDFAPDGVWSACPRFVYAAGPRRRAVAVIDSERAPDLLRSPEAIVDAAEAALPCDSEHWAGRTYHHFVMKPREMLYARWRNPEQATHVAQSALIAAYDAIVAECALRLPSGAR